MFYVWIDSPSSASLPTDFANLPDRKNGFISNTRSSAANVNAGLRQANLISVALMNALGLNIASYDYKSPVPSLTKAISDAILGIKVNNAVTADIALSTRDAGTQANDPSGIAKVFTFANTNGFGTKNGNGYWKLWDLQVISGSSNTYCGLVPSLDSKQLLGSSEHRMKEVWSAQYCGSTQMSIINDGGLRSVKITNTGVYACVCTYNNTNYSTLIVIPSLNQSAYASITLGTSTYNKNIVISYNRIDNYLSGDETYQLTYCACILRFS